MRAKTAFIRWAGKKFGSQPDSIWDLAVAGDLAAKAAVKTWLANDGLLWPESLPDAPKPKHVGRWRLADRGQEPLASALSIIRSRGIGFGQIAAAKVGDFETEPAGKTWWNLRLRGHWPAGRIPIDSDLFEAVKTVARWDRTEPAKPEDPLLVFGWPAYKLARLCKALGTKPIDSDSTAA